MILAAVALLAAAAVTALVLMNREHKGFVIVNAGADPFRSSVEDALRKGLADLGAKPEEVSGMKLGGKATTDDIPWDEIPQGSVVISLLPAGKLDIPEGRLVVCGPLRDSERPFAIRNASRALFAISDYPPDFAVGLVTGSTLFKADNITLGIASPSAPMAAHDFGALKTVVCDDAGEFVEKLPTLSCLLLLVDGYTPSVVSRWAEKCVDRRIALIADRKGYMNEPVAAVLSPQPEAAGDTLSRMAWKVFCDGVTGPELREVALLFAAYSVSTAAMLDLRWTGNDFAPSGYGK